jgi:hypothetical protein
MEGTFFLRYGSIKINANGCQQKRRSAPGRETSRQKGSPFSNEAVKIIFKCG